MKNKFQKRVIIYILLVVVCALIIYPKIKEYQEIAEKRKQLANIMGVSLDQYPFLPDDYFPYKISEGMTMEEVHKIVVGYEKVFHVPSFEVYYYFSSDDDKSDRIEIMYNDDFEVLQITQEDENSRTLTTNGWDEGPLIR